MNLAILGAGAYGTALGGLAAKNGHAVKYYDPYKFPEKNHPENSLNSVTKDAEAILFVAPSEAAPEIIKDLEKVKDLPLICASKGFLSAEIFKNFPNFSALGGAAFAEDIEAEAPRFGDEIILTASSPLAEQLFSAEFLRVEYTKDTLGIMLCGALKNVYAIGAGLGLVADLRALYLELRSILSENGADPETAKLSCGLSDLFMSVASKTSRNYLYGLALRSGKTPENSLAEGAAVIKAIKSEKTAFRLPETAHIIKQIVEKASITAKSLAISANPKTITAINQTTNEIKKTTTKKENL